MLKQYFKIAIRNLQKQKGLASINILGLSIGTAWIFIIAGIAAIFIAMFTVTMQAMKAAVSNPVKALRTE